MVSVILVSSIKVCEKIIQIPKLTDKEWEADWSDIYKIALCFGGIVDFFLTIVSIICIIEALA